MLSKHHQVRRQFVESNVEMNKKLVKISMKANGDHNHQYISSSGGHFSVKSNGSQTIKIVIEDGYDLQSATSRFFHTIGENWLTSLICITLTLLTLFLLFTFIRYYYFERREVPTEEVELQRMTANTAPSSALLGKDHSLEV